MVNNFQDYLGKNSVPFVKMQGCGNDFILVEGSNISTETHLSEIAKKLCN